MMKRIFAWRSSSNGSQTRMARAGSSSSKDGKGTTADTASVPSTPVTQNAPLHHVSKPTAPNGNGLHAPMACASSSNDSTSKPADPVNVPSTPLVQSSPLQQESEPIVVNGNVAVAPLAMPVDHALPNGVTDNQPTSGSPLTVAPPIVDDTLLKEKQKELDVATSRIAELEIQQKELDAATSKIAELEIQQKELGVATSRIAELEGQLESSKQDKARLEGEFGASEQDIVKLREGNSALQQESAAKDERIIQLQQQIASLESTVSTLQAECKNAQEDRDLLRDQRAKELEEKSNLEQLREKALIRIASLERASQVVKEENMQLKEGVVDGKTEIERLREECSSLRSLLNENDSCSGAEVLQAVKDLNAKANNLAATLSDRWDRNSVGSGRIMTEDEAQLKFEEARVSLEYVLGPRFIDILSRQAASPPDEKDVTVVMFALQACVVRYLTDVFESFCFGLSDEQNLILTTIYEQVYQKEPQALSSRWRILSHSYARSAVENYQAIVHEHISSNLLGYVCDVYYLSGGKRDIDADLRADFGSDVDNIADTALQLAFMMKEKVTSTVFEVFAPNQDQEFAKDTMQDVLEMNDSGEVLCTVDMGLVQLIRKSKGGVYEESEKVLYKAKVIPLQSLQEFVTIVEE